MVTRPDYANASGSQIIVDVLANDSGHALELSIPSTWSLNGGQLSLTDNKIAYTAKVGFNGTDKVYYTLRDSRGATQWNSITIAVSGNNPYPVGNEDAVLVVGGRQLSIDVLSNDIGNGLYLLTPNAWSWKGGSVSLLNNTLRYTPKAGFSGEDKIWYTFRDVEGRQSWSVVNIKVDSGGTYNPFPIGQPDTFSVVQDTRVIFDVLANDIGNGLELNPLNSAWSRNGGNVLLSDNKLSYQSKADYVGEDKIWYTFKDVEGREVWSVVTINVTN